MPISPETQASELGFCDREIRDLAIAQQSPRIPRLACGRLLCSDVDQRVELTAFGRAARLVWLR